MMFNEDEIRHIQELMLKQLKSELSPSEEAELRAWANTSSTRQIFMQEVTDEETLDAKLRRFAQTDEADVWEHKKIWDTVSMEDDWRQKPSKTVAWWKYAAVAALLLASAATFYFPRHQQPAEQHQAISIAASHDIEPGSDKAVLTLSDGKRIILDTATAGILASQGNTTIFKDGNGHLVYNAQKEELTAGQPVWNTISTPRGGQYRVVLPDSTQVWLNSASSITFPAAFTATERRVMITGECYFEVAYDPERPFKADIAGQMQIEVLGTSFNVAAYADERVLEATLLTGSLLVKAMGHATAGREYQMENSKLLKPGQQARMSAAGSGRELDVVRLADPEQAVDWKNGLMSFKNADIRPIMRQLSRWYDLEVTYRGNIPVKHYSGSIKREARLTEALEVLHLVSGARFEVNDRQVIVEFPN